MSAPTMEEIERNVHRRKVFEGIFVAISMTLLLSALLILLGLLIQLFMDGSPRLTFEFLSNFPSRFPERAGILAAAVGTSLVMLVTAAVSVPLGIMAGVYLEEYAPRNPVTTFIEINVLNLAGVPSIVYGLMALGLFVYQFELGQTVRTAGLTLALLILPIVITATREALRGVPHSIREAAYALGASRREVVFHHVLPYSMSGVMTGTIVALSRAIGETAPLVTVGALSFIAFLPASPVTMEYPFLSFEWLSSPFTVMPMQIFNWVSRPQAEFHVNAAAASVLLIFMTLSMNAIAITVRYRYRKSVRW